MHTYTASSHLADLFEKEREGCGLGPGDAKGEDPLARGGGSGGGSHSLGSTSDICGSRDGCQTVPKTCVEASSGAHGHGCEA